MHHDHVIEQLIEDELNRQRHGLELIASGNANHGFLSYE
jgi:glycine/serine hydroxymethyltransferase